MPMLRRVGVTLGYHKKMGKAHPNCEVAVGGGEGSGAGGGVGVGWGGAGRGWAQAYLPCIVSTLATLAW